jgi:hypothetical protein
VSLKGTKLWGSFDGELGHLISSSKYRGGKTAGASRRLGRGKGPERRRLKQRFDQASL